MRPKIRSSPRKPARILRIRFGRRHFLRRQLTFKWTIITSQLTFMNCFRHWSRLTLLCLWGFFPHTRAAELIWQTGDGFRSASVTVAPKGKAGFTRLDSSATGLKFTNQLSETLALNNQILENGAGIALG